MNNAQKKPHARYTMLGYYNDNVSNLKGRTKQTFRDDITKLQYANNGMNLAGQHPLAILYKKYIEIKYQFKRVYFYDNHRRRGLTTGSAEQIVFKVVIDQGKEHLYKNDLAEYYDPETGKPVPDAPINSMPDQNL